MNRFSPLNKGRKFENNNDLLLLHQSPLSTVSQNGNDKIKLVKLESISDLPMKRHRSHSYNFIEYSNVNMYNNDNNHLPFSAHLDDTSCDSTPVYRNNQRIIEKQKKETHNRVERKRRDFINGQIQRLAHLLPSECFTNCDLKMNKGIILKNSVDYISSMKCVEDINRQLIHETELGSRLIEIFVTMKELNCSELFINESATSGPCLDEVNVNSLINEWQSVHQENIDLVQQFSNKLSHTFFDSTKEIYSETMDTTNNNYVRISPSSRKRYSSVPTDNRRHCDGSSYLPRLNVIDYESPAANPLLNSPDLYTVSINELSPPPLNLDTDRVMNTDNGLVDEPRMCTTVSTDENLVQINNQTYYIVPKPSKSNFHDRMNQVSLVNQITDDYDPMLLSDSLNLDNVDH